VALASTIKPWHIFSGILVEVFFGVDGQDGFTPRDGRVWDPREKRMEVWVLEMRSGNLLLRRTLDGEMWKVMTADLVAVCSWTSSMKEVKACYEKVKETLVGWEPKEGIEELGGSL
jgi:hypothetical protein